MHRLRLVALAVASVTLGVVVACTGDDPILSPSANDGGAADAFDERSGNEGGGPASLTGNVLATGTDGPLANARVRIGDKIVATGGDGAFAFDDVPTPYDVDVVSPNGEKATAYRGLTNRNPRLRVDVPLAGGTLGGTITGASFPLPSNQRAVLFFNTGRYANLRTFNVNEIPATGNYTLDVFWQGGESAYGIAGALIETVDVTGPTAFTAYGLRGDTAKNDGGTAATNITLSPITSASMNGTVANAASFSFVQTSVYLTTNEVPEGIRVGMKTVVGGTFSLVTPVVTGATMLVRTFGIKGTDSAIAVVRDLPAMSNAVVTLPVGAVGLSPPDNSVDVDKDSNFSWAFTDPSASSGTYELVVECASVKRVLTVYTTANSLKFPDLAPLAWVVPSKADCQWRVTTYPAIASLDEHVSALDVLAKGGPDSYTTAGKSFTTK